MDLTSLDLSSGISKSNSGNRASVLYWAGLGFSPGGQARRADPLPNLLTNARVNIKSRYFIILEHLDGSTQLVQSTSPCLHLQGMRGEEGHQPAGGAEDRPQRKMPLRQREKVQAVPRHLAASGGTLPAEAAVLAQYLIIVTTEKCDTT